MLQQIEHISFTDIISILTYLFYGTLFYGASGQTLHCFLTNPKINVVCFHISALSEHVPLTRDGEQIPIACCVKNH